MKPQSFPNKTILGTMFLFLTLVACKRNGDTTASGIPITINYNDSAVTFEHFWRSTGFSPGENLLKKDMQQTYDLVGASANLGIEYVRPHYLLNLIGVAGMDKDNPTYNWTLLDSVIDHLVANESKLFFELMGTPSSSLQVSGNSFDADYQEQIAGSKTYFDDFEDRDKLYAWKRFIKDLAEHLMARYGKEEVESWYFEGTNEPDLDIFWPHGTQAYFNYYDACSEGLKEANPNLRFGGPGTALLLSDMFKAVLEHCDSGTNYFTGEKGVRLDFITAHIKELPSKMVANELEIIDYIRKNHPKFAQLPFGNNESDPTYGWNAPVWWRPTPWYSSFIAKSAHLHVQEMARANVDYLLLSNDNGFMGDWYRRTHFARFQSPDNPENVSLIKKPSFTIMGLLRLMGKEQIDVPVKLPHVGVFATKEAQGPLSVMCYNAPDIPIRIDGELVPKLGDSTRTAIQKLDTTLVVSLNNLPFKNPLLVEYRIDEKHGNPFEVWQEMGAPEFPSPNQFDAMQLAEDPVRIWHTEYMTKDRKANLSIDLPHSSVVLLVVGEAPSQEPGPVTGLRSRDYVGANGNVDRVLRWDHLPNNGFLSYDVFYSRNEDGRFKKINPTDLIDAGFVHRLPNPESGKYKVRATYPNGLNGPFSEEIEP